MEQELATKVGADLSTGQLTSTVVYSIVGLIIYVVAFWLICKISPFSVRKEIEEDQNTSLGIIIGSVMIGLSIIISAAIH